MKEVLTLFEGLYCSLAQQLFGALDKAAVGAYRGAFGFEMTQYSPRLSRLSMSRPGPGAAVIMARKEPSMASLAVSSRTRMRTFCGSLIFMSPNGCTLETESLGADSPSSARES